MTAPNSNNNIQSSAEYTVQIAKKELGKTLDYSANSLKDLDALIEHVKKHFSRLTQEGKLTDQIVQRASTSIGAYLGEVIRRTHEGIWVAKNSVLNILVINGQEISPILYAFERLTKNSEYGLDEYWSDTSQKLQSRKHVNTPVQIPAETQKNLPPSNEWSDKKILVTGGIGVFVIICLVSLVVIISTISSNIKAENEFKEKLNLFLTEAEKLNIMTEQGVNYQEFKNQLVEVKSAYTQINSWPSSYQDRKLPFDKAIQGWDLALVTWQFELNSSTILNFTNSTEDIVNYLGPDRPDDFNDFGKWTSALMGKASIYFEAGKAGVK